MKLGGGHVSFLDGTDKPITVISGGQHGVVGSGFDVVGMDKVEFFVAFKACKQLGGLLNIQSVPADVGNGKIGGKPLYVARDEPQSRHIGRLLTLFKQGLEPQADAQERTIGFEIGH